MITIHVRTDVMAGRPKVQPHRPRHHSKYWGLGDWTSGSTFSEPAKLAQYSKEIDVINASCLETLATGFHGSEESQELKILGILS